MVRTGGLGGRFGEFLLLPSVLDRLPENRDISFAVLSLLPGLAEA